MPAEISSNATVKRVRLNIPYTPKRLGVKTIFQGRLWSYQNRETITTTITTTNTMTKTDKLEKLMLYIERFRVERNWQQFHTPKNLAMALSVECAELLEIFQWMTPDQSLDPDLETRLHLEEEIGDVMIYLSLLASTFAIDPLTAALKKMKANERKYPIPNNSQQFRK